jgi:hypothetical protein
VFATNSTGNGPESPVSSVVPLALPGLPTNVQATAGNGTATVTTPAARRTSRIPSPRTPAA